MVILSLEHIIKIVLAVILGSVIGVQRKSEGKPAGLRTYAIVCLGATLISIISSEYFAGDPTRIAAGVITGVGFLGGGAIIAAGGKVHGLTTAAGLWVMAAVGLTIGAGGYMLATVVTVIVMLVLTMGKEKR